MKTSTKVVLLIGGIFVVSTIAKLTLFKMSMQMMPIAALSGGTPVYR